MPKLLLIDNRDSFTWNIAQALLALGAEVDVRRAEALELSDRAALAGYDRVVVGPGPGGPAGTGASQRSLALCRGRIPWLGVCLGHQVLAQALGLPVVPTGTPVHGKADWIHHDRSGIFRGLPVPFAAARYHSLAVRPGPVPPPARVAAWSATGEVMALGIPGEATWGVQFHPESYLTPDGPRLLAAFLEGVPCPGTGGRDAQ